MHAVRTAQICILDGVGIVLAARYHNIPLGERITGVDLMSDLITQAGNMRLRVLLIGGRPNLALSLSKCYQDKYSEAKFFGTMGFKDIQHPTKTEEAEILAIVRRNKPHMILAAFGSPWQELWLARHSKEFKGIVCMGVGQGFDVAGGLVKRAPVLIQNIGLEWLYRLIAQPWRWRRQLRLFKFMWLIITS
ncbi:MAG: WecB/TagA/CpsF family glycosyltransferase [bacterium]|nr:WecB/TagA/CpsF family glycosyltransferase [bacterium]